MMVWEQAVRKLAAKVTWPLDTALVATAAPSQNT